MVIATKYLPSFMMVLVCAVSVAGARESAYSLALPAAVVKDLPEVIRAGRDLRDRLLAYLYRAEFALEGRPDLSL